jgi:hypothetical protein
MRSHSAAHTRRAHRAIPAFVGIGFIAVCIICSVIFLRLFVQPFPYRQSLVIAGNPTHIISINAAKNNIIVVDVPEDTVISATHGYGNYPIRSLITLDDIDNHHGALVTGSMSDAFGIPIKWYVNPGELGNGDGTVSLIRSIFSFGNLFRVLQGSMDTSMPLATWINLVWALRFIPADGVESINIRQAIIHVDTPDGSSVSTLDENKLDYMLENSLFDSGLRAEGITAAIYNTTQVPTVGLRASRQVSRMGVQLVFVGNAEPTVSECQINGLREALQSKTADYLADYFGCKKVEGESDIGRGTGADLVVLLGEKYASQYK